jgi:hypothetical protein
VTLGVSRRGAVVEIVRLVGVRTRRVDACRGLRRARVAPLRLRVDSVALIVCLILRRSSKCQSILGYYGEVDYKLCLRLHKVALTSSLSHSQCG